jgi:hypothetical protein
VATHAQAQAKSTQKTAIIGQRDIERREYTDQQLSALFTALDDEEN